MGPVKRHGERGRHALIVILLGILPLLSGCAQVRALRSNPWVERIITYAPGLTWCLIKWTVIGSVVAIPIALITFFGLRKIGGFRWKWEHAKYFRALTCVLILLMTVAFGALIGLNEGAYRGLRDVVNSAELKEELQPMGGSGADVVGAIYIVVARTPPEELAAALKEEQERLMKREESTKAETGDPDAPEKKDPEDTPPPTEEPPTEDPSPATPPEEALPNDGEEPPPEKEPKGPAMLALEKRIAADLETFRNGEWDVNVAELKKKAVDVKQSVFDIIFPAIKEQIRDRIPSLKEGRDAKIMDWFIDTFGEMLVTKIVNDELEKAKLRGPIIMIWEGLESAAEGSGDPDTISYKTLSGYLPSRVVYACAVYPTKLAVRGNQTGMVLIWFLIILGFVILFQVTEFCRARNVHGRTWAWIKVKTGHAEPPPEGPIITPPPEEVADQGETTENKTTEQSEENE